MFCAFGCGSKQDRMLLPKENTSFFGDSVLTILSSDRPNGYSISILKNKDLCLWHFQRGDTINRYLALPYVPFHIEEDFLDTTGVFTCDFELPILNKLSENTYYGNPYFFMDVNFDGEAEFIVAYEGFNRIYYACFDLVNGNRYDSWAGFLSPMDEKPYDNIVGGWCGETKFDYKNQIIHITEDMGSRDTVETWAKPMKSDYYEDKPKVRVFKKIEKNYFLDGSQHITEYGLVNDTLKEISYYERRLE